MGIELEVITACVLGGVSLAGGRGRILSVALGVALIWPALEPHIRRALRG